MDPPKNSRVTALRTSIVDSPLRRRSGVHGGQQPDSAQRHLLINDDEAERRNSRRLEETSFSGVSSIVVEDTDSLNMCLQMHSENKISKDNAWTVSIIDTFSKLIRNHHKSMQNFQIAGSTLEASAKVYGLRVDSVYNDGVRMVSELSRQSAKAMMKQANKGDDDDDSDNEANKENSQTVEEAAGYVAKPKRAKKKRSTVTKNKDTLNAKLETVPFTDPFFAKQNSVVGDINSSKRLMQNILSSIHSCLKLHQNGQYWDKSSAQLLDLVDAIEDINVASLPDEAITVITSLIIHADMNLHFHPTLKDYIISDQQIEEDNAELSKFDNDANSSNHQAFNSSQIEMQFDINAEVEPFSQENPFVVDYGEMDQNDFDELNDDDQLAINRCRGLKRQPVMIEDMQPNDSIQLEYSYRALDHIGQFWAGPAHWKFRRANSKSMNFRMSASENGVATQNQAPARKKRAKKTPTELTLEYVLSFNNTLVKRTNKTKSTCLVRSTLIKKWDSKKLKLPIDFKFDKDCFGKFLHAPNLRARHTVNVALTPDELGDTGYNYNNQSDRDYCSRVIEDEDDFESETATSQQDNENVLFNGQQPVDFISDEFVGAPDRVEKINIIFAKRAKTIDMKQLKTCCWKLINENKPTNTDSGTKKCVPMHFTNLIINLPKVLNKAMAENMSTSLAFYSVLHLANENNLVMTQSEDLRDFDIEMES